jgi:capsule polysaccharide export protein KpsE/RkpR
MTENINNSGQVQIPDFIIIFAKYSRMIILVSATVAILTYLVLFILPNKYTAKASLLPPQQNLTMSGQLLEIMGGNVLPGAVGVGGGGMGGMAASLLGLKTPGEIYVSMMKSDKVSDRIIARFNLMDLYGAKFIEDGRKALSKNANITAGKKDGLIVIEVTSITPRLSAEMANAFIEELERLLQALAMQEAKGRLAFLEKERIQASQNLTKAEEAVRLFSEENSVLQIDTQTRGALEYIARLRAEIDSKEVSIQVLRQQATPFNYDVVRMETEIKGLKEKLRNVECEYGSNITDVCLPTNKAPGLALAYIRLYREVKFQESLYQIYIKLVEIARMDMARDIAVIQKLDTAKPPEKRSNTRGRATILAGMITFFMMIFVTWGREQILNMNLRENDTQRLALLNDYLKPWREILTRVKTIFSRNQTL